MLKRACQETETKGGGWSMVIGGSVVIDGPGLARRVQLGALWAWTLYRSDRAMVHLGCLSLALGRRGLHRVELHPDTVTVFPVLVVSTGEPIEDAAVLAVAKATPGGWGFFDAMRDPWGFIGPCRDAVTAADRVARMLHDPLPASRPAFRAVRCGRGAR
ncbi:hypothetical protein ABT299_52195 [Spirillospora sp. NPDC000708]